MAVTLRYCEVCGKKLTPEELQSPETADCKADPPQESCPLRVLEMMRKKKAATDAVGGAPQRPAAPRRAPQRAKPAAKAAADSAGASPAGPGKKVASKKVASKKVAGKKVAKKVARRPGAKKPSVGGTTPTAKSASPLPAAGKKKVARKKVGTRAGAVSAGGRVQRPVAARAGDTSQLGDEGEPRTFEIKKRSNAPLIIILGVIVLGGGGLGYAILNTEVPKPIDRAAEARKKREAEAALAESLGQEKAQKALEEAKAYWKDNPTDFEDSYYNFASIAGVHARYAEIATEADRLAQEVLGEGRAAVSAEWQEIQTFVNVNFSTQKFADAFDRVKSSPDLFAMFASDELIREFKELHRLAKIQKRAAGELQELKRKALIELEAKRPDIAEWVARSFDERYEEDAPDVWAANLALISSIERGSFEETLKRDQAAALAKKEQDEAARRQRLAARMARWKESIASVGWASQINYDNLYNWVVNSDGFFNFDNRKWQVRREGENGVLTGENSGDSSMYIGCFTDHWEDYVLEFEVNVGSGSLDFVARQRAKIVRGGMASIGEKADPIAIDSSFGSGWVKLRFEVQGEEVRMKNVSNGQEKTFTMEDINLPSQGGFCFYLPKDGKVQIKNLRSKLVNSVRNLPF